MSDEEFLKNTIIKQSESIIVLQQLVMSLQKMVSDHGIYIQDLSFRTTKIEREITEIKTAVENADDNTAEDIVGNIPDSTIKVVANTLHSENIPAMELTYIS